MQKKKAPLSAKLFLLFSVYLVVNLVWTVMTEGYETIKGMLMLLSAAAVFLIPLIVFLVECYKRGQKRSEAEAALRVVSFGPYKAAFSVGITDEETLERAKYISHALFRRKEEILERIYAEAHRICTLWQETDEEGVPVTAEYVKAHYSLTEIFMKEGMGGEVITSFGGYVFKENHEAMLDGRKIVAKISNVSDEIVFVLK